VGISAASFRDHTLESICVAYDWEFQSHSVDILVRNSAGRRFGYRIDGVTDLNIREDFKHIEEIEMCTFLAVPGRIYISLDPYTEGAESERDNYCIAGKSISVVE
jgi:hypothetical protein